MTRLLKQSLLITMCGGCLWGFTGCDNDYDLTKDISSDISVGGQVSIPIGETEILKLSRAIELGDDIIENENGEYAISQSSEMNVDIPEIEHITMRDLSMNPTEVSIESGTGSAATPIDCNISTHLDYTMQVQTTEDVPSEVKKLTYAEVPTVNAILRFKLHSDGSLDMSKLSDINLRQFTVRLPKMFIFKSGIENLDYTTNTLTINKPFENGIIEFILPVVAITDIPDVNQETHTIDVHNIAYCAGTFTAVGKQVTGNELSSLSMTTTFDIPDFDIFKVRGTFTPKITVKADQISIGELPDMLTSENTTVSLNRIFTEIEIENPSGVPFKNDFILSAFDKNNRPINSTVKISVDVPAAIDYTTSSITKYFVTNTDECEAPAGYQKIVNPELSKLIAKIPNFIQMQPEVTIDESQEHFFLLEDYRNTNTMYHFTMPFDFGGNSHIEYIESINDIQSDLEDVIDKISYMEIEAEVTNTIPLQLVLNAVPYDRYGNDMSDEVEISKDILIEPGSETAPLQEKRMLIKEINKGSLENLDRIELRVSGTTEGARSILKPSQYVHIKLNAKLPEGFNIEF